MLAFSEYPHKFTSKLKSQSTVEHQKVKFVCIKYRIICLLFQVCLLSGLFTFNSLFSFRWSLR